IILAIIVLFVNANLSSVTGVGESIVNVAAYVSVTLNLILISVLLVLVTSKRIGLIFTIIILKILNKLKIVKDYSKTFKKVTRYVREYQHAVRKYIVGSSESLSSFIVSVLIWIISGSIPFFLYLAFTNVETITFELWLLIISKYFALMLATSLLPLPGATGTAELSFAALFGTLFSGSALVWAILFWRLLTYYVYILQGIIVIVFNAIKVKFLKHKATQIA
ncbi:MAG: flippase-like domain-containing protein, partial [Clostridia bacterium]|nr:flippase-like domain-containing protein [Clostridia bacterium]